MRFVTNAVDYGTALEFNIGGVASIERISPGQVRVSFFQTFRGADGLPEHRIVLHHIWDYVNWLKFAESWDGATAKALIESECGRSPPFKLAVAH